jgi:glyoxylase-like metal-dependent hydrolase (beta-lactamase superfamily II)
MSKKIIHEILPVGLLQCNCSIIGDPETREALVVDPGDEADRILQVLAKHALTVKAIVSTHAHIDHVGGLRKMQQATGAPVLMHGDDMELYRHLDMQAVFIGMRAPDPASVDTLLREGDTLRWGGFTADVLHTPGHTPGSISLYLAPRPGEGGEADPGKLLAGDTLFAGSIGRTD